MSSYSFPGNGNYPPPNPAPALDSNFLFSCLAERLQNDIKNSFGTHLVAELVEKEDELLKDISAYLDSRISEFSTFATNLVLKGSQEDRNESSANSHTQESSGAKDKGYNNNLLNESFQDGSYKPDITTFSGGNDTQVTSGASSLSETSLSAGLPLKSSLAKPKNKKKLAHSKLSPDSPDSVKVQKKVMFSNNDQITIVPSLEDLEENFDSQDDSESSEEGTSAEPSGSNTSDIDPPPYTSASEPFDSDFDDDFNSTVAVSQQQFVSPLYSDSSYSSGLDSLECSPVQSGLMESPLSTIPLTLNESLPSSPPTYEERHLNSSPISHTPEESTPTPSEPTSFTLPAAETQADEVETKDDSSSDESDREVFQDEDEIDDVFQFDETLGVMQDSPDPFVTKDDLISFPTSQSTFRTQFSNSPSLYTNYQAAGSLPSNQSRTSQSQLPTVVGSLRPRPMTKYKLDRGSGHRRLPPIAGSGSNSLASSLSSSTATVTPTDRFYSNSGLQNQHINGISTPSSAHSSNNSHNVSNFASSLPIQINASSWGHLARQSVKPITSKSPALGEQSVSRSFLNNDQIVEDLENSDNNKMLLYNDRDGFSGSLNGSTGLQPDDPILDEDISLYASPSSAAQIMNSLDLQPDQMSFSQRLMWERRSNPRH